MKLTKTVSEQIRKHAETKAPEEACGFILRAGRKQTYRPCTNVAANPQETFEISADDWLAVEGEVEAIVHSHPQGEPYLSGADRQMQVQTGLPWVLYTGGTLKVFRPCPHLRGRMFEYGEADCGTLVRDAFMLCGLDLPDHERTDLDADATAGHWLQHLAAIGAYQVYDMQPGDVVLTTYGGYASHAAFYLGDGEMLHHAYGQLSRREPYSESWAQSTHSVWRHRDWKPEMLEGLVGDLQHRVS